MVRRNITSTQTQAETTYSDKGIASITLNYCAARRMLTMLSK
ncbi:hypothetical protein RB2150_12471 [Rhodobacteraceae bacterium HTCC2150]|nr:hypothetical protein RB2150_12471 [Rhodobacteraceae bacterium HTCC2150]